MSKRFDLDDEASAVISVVVGISALTWFGSFGLKVRNWLRGWISLGWSDCLIDDVEGVFLSCPGPTVHVAGGWGLFMNDAVC